MQTTYVSWFLVVLYASVVSSTYSSMALGQNTKQPFSVAAEIELRHFGDPYMATAAAIHFSPDGAYFAADTERGRLDLNRPEDSLRFYRSRDVEKFIIRANYSQTPSPIWVVTRSTCKEGPIISQWRWLADSSGVAFLERTEKGSRRLVLADLRKKRVETLTTAEEDVSSFDIRDRQHFVYTVSDRVAIERWKAERRRPTTVGAGRSLVELLFPDNPMAGLLSVSSSYRNRNLWAVLGGKRFEILNAGTPIVTEGDLSLSPDSRSLVTTVPITEVPPSWEMLYPPPFASSHYRIRAGKPQSHLDQYVRINLQTGAVQALTETPIGDVAGWWVERGASWSSDGQAIVLAGTFLKSADDSPSRPCVAVVDLPSRKCTCVEKLKGHTETGVEQGYYLIDGVQFKDGDKKRLVVSFHNYGEDWLSMGTTEYERSPDGTWQVVRRSKKWGGEIERNGLHIEVKQGLNEPPLLMATIKQKSRIIWNPNPQLRHIELGQATLYRWKDKGGQDRIGGLYKPANYESGRPYPLVIQTHGFLATQFEPSGLYPTAFAARAMAASGILVLQVGVTGDCGLGTLDEGPCKAEGFETVATQLVADGIADPENIGIIGFSRTCFHVMEMLASSPLQLKAASLTDGYMVTYLQYMLDEVGTRDESAPEPDSLIGASPFGAGLQQWLRRSPGFNLDKILTPLVINGAGPYGVLYMWEPYAGLRHLHRPVDLIELNTNEHILTNPAVRIASQGGSVDWFRFWLQNYEDPDPDKLEQYKRWHELRSLHEHCNKNK